MRSLKIFHLPILLAVGLILGLAITGCAKKPSVEEDIRPVRALVLTPSQQHVVAEYSGNVQPRIEARLGFRVNGKISSRKVDVGNVVKAGQILMQVDPQDLQLAESQAKAGLSSAQTNLELANLDLKRYQELRKTNAVSQGMLDAKITAATAAQASVDQAKAQLKGQTNQARYADLIANADGIVTGVSAEVGQVVAAGTPVVQVAQLGELEVVVGIPENNVDAVSKATSVQIRLWANPQDVMPGKIRELSPVADPATRTFNAKVSILNASPAVAANVKLGMTAVVQFAINTPNAFIKVPLTALFQNKGVTSLWIVDNNTVKLVPVQIGGVNGNDLLLAGGVSAGQTVVTAGVHLLKPGQRVTILEEATPTATTTDPYLSAQTLLKPVAVTETKPAAKAGATK